MQRYKVEVRHNTNQIDQALYTCGFRLTASPRMNKKQEKQLITYIYWLQPPDESILIVDAFDLENQGGFDNYYVAKAISNSEVIYNE